MNKTKIFQKVLLMTLPLAIISLYGLLMYGNTVGPTSMGGFEIAVFLFVIVIPTGLISFLVFISDIIRLKKSQGSVKQELRYFIFLLVIFGGVSLCLALLARYCSINMCDFIPLKQYY